MFQLANLFVCLSAGVDGVGMDVNNLVKVTGRKNMELAMRITSGLASERVFYTDLNGLQVSSRQFYCVCVCVCVCVLTSVNEC